MSGRVAFIGTDKEIFELLAELHPDWVQVGVIDADPHGDKGGLPWLGDDPAWPGIRDRMPDLRLVMTLDGGPLKRRLASRYGNELFVSVCARDAHLSPSASVGAGSVIQRQAMVLAGAQVGRLCKLNAGAVIHHDCRVGDFCTLAPGSRLLGCVTLEESVFIGAGAIVNPHVRIGRDAIIGAGAVVTRDVPAGVTAVGVPARVISRKQAHA